MNFSESPEVMLVPTSSTRCTISGDKKLAIIRSGLPTGKLIRHIHAVA
jgi:hypothetical protein